MTVTATQDLLEAICTANLNVYRASPTRLQEDVSQEAQISNDYRGRLIYELLQNADDAMAGHATIDDRIIFRLTDDELWVGNSGRPLGELDVKGLCGLGASSKRAVVGRRRASIGHKGMGFKSVLEITNAPEVISIDYAFQMSAERARGRICDLMEELGEQRPDRVPVMRFPTRIDDFPEYWQQLGESGIRTLFRFPLRPELTLEQRSLLADRLLALPVTAILFLKHLERVEVSVETETRTAGYTWTVGRERRTATGWEPSPELTESGIHRVGITTTDGAAYDYLLAHDAEVEIGEHRGGLDAEAWQGIDVSEVSVATLLEDGVPAELPVAWQLLHVFLPTLERCPYPLLVNGAFSSDLSRQEIRVGAEATDYNRFLMRRVAALFRDVLLAELRSDGIATEDILRLLDRKADEPGIDAATTAGQALYEAMRNELGGHPLLPAEGSAQPIALNSAIVPPLVTNNATGEEFRTLLPERANHGQRSFPHARICGSALARVAVDHGARALSPAEVPAVLASANLDEVALELHESGGLSIDPVLRVLEGVWEGIPASDREDFAAAVRRQPLFPTGRRDDVVQRVVTDGIACFYPPRTLTGTVPLERLSFLMQELCWGTLIPRDRNQILKDQLVAWQALFELREFKFPEVMRASVLPALDLTPGDAGALWIERLQTRSSLAAICQLSGRAPDPGRPLRYERLGSNRGLFNLSRLPVPCRANAGDDFEWRPAYTVYLGEDWIGEASVEHVLAAAREQGAEVPEIPFLAAPEHFEGLLARFQHLARAADEGADADEVSPDEDDEAAPDQADHDRWLDFLTWIGVNRVLRPVHFHDVDDRATGWLTTKDLIQPAGWAFKTLAPNLWDPFRSRVQKDVVDSGRGAGGVSYFYALHDLEYVVHFLKAAAADASNHVSSALFAHLASNWGRLEKFTRAQVAIVPTERAPTMRTKPPRAWDDELADAGDDFWVTRLRNHDWCPTTLGPRRPNRVWLRTPELERRFGRQGSDPGVLLPLLVAEQALTQGKSRGLAQTLGIRADPTPSNFTPPDASGLLARLQETYAAATPDERQLRQVIRPAYRNLMELLPGTEAAMVGAYEPGSLATSPLLVHDGRGHYRFDRADRVYYSERSGTRERIGEPEDLWTFVLEASPAARGPLAALFGVRILEDELVWTPLPGDHALDADDAATFRAGLRQLAPYILARLGADRQDERLVAQDSRRLRDFIDVVEPVTELSVRCRLGDRALGAQAERGAFVEASPAGGLKAFVVWGEEAWPPQTREEREALATAVADVLDAGHLEAFLALIDSTSHESRVRLLRLAGAPTDLDAARNALDDAEDMPAQVKSAIEPPRTPGMPTEEEAPVPASQTETAASGVKTPLFQPQELLVDGVPVLITGDAAGPSASSDHVSPGGTNGGQSGAYGGNTDLDELNQLGMYVALAFERSRLRHEGVADAEIFDPGRSGAQPTALVFDVSTFAALAAARTSSSTFDEAFTQLENRGLSAQAPGFDILSLNPNGANRLIELKSSGVNARLQEMSWNEWKSARHSDLRELFYLYLVGNLRRDLGDAHPFIRAVHDPFQSIWAEEIEQSSKTRRVQLRVTQFTAAEHLDLTVRRLQPD